MRRARMQERERRRAGASTISGKRRGQFIARTAVEPRLRAILAGKEAEAVVFDLVQPLAPRRPPIGFCLEARRHEPPSGRENAPHQARPARPPPPPPSVAA